MSATDYPGVNPKWLRRRKTWFKNLTAWHDEYLKELVERLDHFIEHGFIKPSDERFPCTTYGQWEPLDRTLYDYADLRNFELVIKGTTAETPCFDTELAVHAYAAYYLEASINRCFDKALFFTPTVLGVVIGCGEPALQLARATIQRERRNYERDERSGYPIQVLMYALLADYLGEPFVPPIPQQENPDYALVWALLKIWRDPDPEAIKAAALAVCDHHTYSKVFEHQEWFGQMPIEILLLFRLRQMLGLDNPQLDHPLMNTALGKLPEPVTLQYDDLTSRVRARMIREGFDETLVYGTDEWCVRRRESLMAMRPFLYTKTRDLGDAIAAEHKALAVAEREGQGARVFSSLRALAVMHRAKDRKAEAVELYERALALAEPGTDHDPDLILRDLVSTYHDLSRAADAEAVCRKYAYEWPGPQVFEPK